MKNRKNYITILLSVCTIAVCGASIGIRYWGKHLHERKMKTLLAERVDSLRAAGSFMPDTVNFAITIVRDSVRAQEIRDYFQLDTLYKETDDTWTKALAIGRLVAQIPHANQHDYPTEVNAIGLWEYTKNVEPAFNCRLHSIMTFELLSAAGITARYVTCLPKDSNDCDCHVMNEVWLPEQHKWVMLDTDMRHFVTDKNGNLLSLREIREHYISGQKMLMWQDFADPSNRIDYYYAYLAKNTYWFQCWRTLSYYQEDMTHPEILRDGMVDIVPSGYTPRDPGMRNMISTNADQFWSEPVIL